MACKGGTLKSGTDNYYPNAYYKVGDLFLTTRNENPSLRFGGTWELFGKGKTLVCVDEDDNDFNVVNKTGGEKAHKLTVSEIPSHSHAQYVTANSGYGVGLRQDYNGEQGEYGQYPQGVETALAGGGQLHNNLQPYITCYIWIRTE